MRRFVLLRPLIVLAAAMFSTYLTQPCLVGGSVRRSTIAFIISHPKEKGKLRTISWKLFYNNVGRFESREEVAARLEGEGAGSEIINKIKQGGRK